MEYIGVTSHWSDHLWSIHFQHLGHPWGRWKPPGYPRSSASQGATGVSLKRPHAAWRRGQGCCDFAGEKIPTPWRGWWCDMFFCVFFWGGWKDLSCVASFFLLIFAKGNYQPPGSTSYSPDFWDGSVIPPVISNKLPPKFPMFPNLQESLWNTWYRHFSALRGFLVCNGFWLVRMKDFR